MGIIPHWIVRRGITLIGLLILLLLAGSWLFKYPDVIRSQITLTTENPPAPIVAKASGRLQKLFVQDTQEVSQGQVLALIENPALFTDIQEVKNRLTSFQGFLSGFDTLMYLPFENHYQLGSAQTAYSDFLKDYKAYQTFIRVNYHRKKLAALRKELGKYRIYYNRLYRQRNLLEEELQLVKNQAHRDSQLYKTNVIAQAEMDRSNGALLAKKRVFEQARINLSEADIQISRLEQEMIQAQADNENQKKDFEYQLIKSTGNLNASLLEWEQTYLLKAPEKGRVSFSKFWAQDQNVKMGDKVLTVVPEKPGSIIGKMELTMRRSGKVKPGQTVNIKLDNYPFMEYGMLPGYVGNISITASEQHYMVEVILSEGLTTNYNIPLEFNQEMTGTGEIITENRRLLSRLLNPFKYVFERNMRSRPDR